MGAVLDLPGAERTRQGLRQDALCLVEYPHPPIYFFARPRQMATKKKSAWIKHVLKVFRKNKKAGLGAAMRKAKRTFRKKRS